MPKRVRTTIFGEKELYSNLKNLPKAVQAGMKDSLAPAARVFKESARKNLAERVNPKYSTKKLEKSINIEFNLKNFSARIGPDGSAVNKRGEDYSEWVEFGHYMTGGKKLYNKDNPEASNYAGARWWPGHHYMTRSYQQNRSKVFKDIQANMTKTLDKYVVDAQKNVRHRATKSLVGSLR